MKKDASYNMIHASGETDIWVVAEPNPPTNLEASESEMWESNTYLIRIQQELNNHIWGMNLFYLIQ